MLRLIIVVLLPLAAPFLIYAVVAWFLLRRRAAAGTPGSVTVDWRAAPLAWLLAAGACCALAVLVYLNATTGYSPDTKLAPPALVDGVVVPSHPLP
jgi:hypothetical protein